jgi:hypothetical protein
LYRSFTKLGVSNRTQLTAFAPPSRALTGAPGTALPIRVS